MGPMVLGVHKMPNEKKPLKLLVVCLGNVCRSPAMEAVLQSLFREKGLSEKILVESRGLSERQQGKKIDPRMKQELFRRGYFPSETRQATLFSESDWYSFDYILAVDQTVLTLLQSRKPSNAHCQLYLISAWSTEGPMEIFDPYKESDERVPECISCIEAHAKNVVAFFENKLTNMSY